MKTVTKIEMADDKNIYNIMFGKKLSVIEDDGDYIITDTEDDDGELFRTPSQAEAIENIAAFAIDDDLIVTGFGEHAGSKPKPDKRQPITVKLPPDIIERLRDSELSQSVMIETALREKYGWN